MNKNYYILNSLKTYIEKFLQYIKNDSQSTFIFIIILLGVFLRLLYIFTSPIGADESFLFYESKYSFNYLLSFNRIFFIDEFGHFTARGFITPLIASILIKIFNFNLFELRIFFMLISYLGLFYAFKFIKIFTTNNIVLFLWIFISFDPITIKFISINFLTEPLFFFCVYASLYLNITGFKFNNNKNIYFSIIISFISIFVRIVGVLLFFFIFLTTIIYFNMYFKSKLPLINRKYLIVISSIILFGFVLILFLLFYVSNFPILFSFNPENNFFTVLNYFNNVVFRWNDLRIPGDPFLVNLLSNFLFIIYILLFLFLLFKSFRERDYELLYVISFFLINISIFMILSSSDLSDFRYLYPIVYIPTYIFVIKFYSPFKQFIFSFNFDFSIFKKRSLKIALLFFIIILELIINIPFYYSSMNTYSDIERAGLWIKNDLEGEKIIAEPYFQIIAYLDNISLIYRLNSFTIINQTTFYRAVFLDNISYIVFSFDPTKSIDYEQLLTSPFQMTLENSKFNVLPQLLFVSYSTSFLGKEYHTSVWKIDFQKQN